MKIFLSSTYKDLVDHRARAANAIERLGQQGVRMEVFGARPVQATKACFDEIQSSDVLFGIYAHRYGYVPQGSEFSITEQEFDFAQDKHKPTFCFLVDEDFPWLPRFIEQDLGYSRLKRFKEKISSVVVRDTFTTPDDLAYKISASLGRFLITSKIKEELEKIPYSSKVSTESGRSQVARRAERLQSIIKGARILLVNDIPSEMKYVIALMEDLGMNVDVTTSSADAIASLAGHNFDVVVSDMRRGSVHDEGLRFLSEARRRGLSHPTIFTVGQYEPSRGTPAYAFGITNRVDELLNLVFDILERARG